MIRKILSKISFGKKKNQNKPIKFSSTDSDVRVKEAAKYVGVNFKRALIKLSDR